jgi:hypothetical protein
MTDPTLTRMNLGFEMFAIAVFVWASIDYNRFIKFWVLKPAPYTSRVKIVFRIFFLACVIGGLWRLAEDFVRYGGSASLGLTALPITAAWLVVFYFMLRLVERMKAKRQQDINSRN